MTSLDALRNRSLLCALLVAILALQSVTRVASYDGAAWARVGGYAAVAFILERFVVPERLRAATA
ncbi:hypothetical protein ACFQGT_09250 [Natrialbaceae archaeon GCM10025810]|uniref:hypothetical protein n=1 Tax=Halovalidus salilacus TaxID=3075124 RepID=UPI003609F1A9